MNINLFSSIILKKRVYFRRQRYAFFFKTIQDKRKNPENFLRQQQWLRSFSAEIEQGAFEIWRILWLIV